MVGRMVRWHVFAVGFLQITCANRCFPDVDKAVPPQGVRLRLVRRGWATHRLITAAARILLTEKLGFDVDVVDVATPPIGDYQQIAQGNVDANFEVWPSGKEHVHLKWVVNGGATQSGSHGIIPMGGIYMPKYSIDRLYVGENLADDELRQVFYLDLKKQALEENFLHWSIGGEAAADAGGLCNGTKWKCNNFMWRPPHCVPENASVDNCRVEMLHGPVGWDQGILEQQIANEALNITVTYLSPATLARRVWAAYASRQHILFHYQEPEEPIFDLPLSNFVRVSFAPPEEECQKRHSEDPTGGLNCEVAAPSAQILVSPHFKSNQDAYALAQHMSLSNDHIQELLSNFKAYAGDANEAACNWLKNGGTDLWGGWVHRSKSVPLSPFLGGCWPLLFMQLAVASISIVVGTVIATVQKHQLVCEHAHTIREQRIRCSVAISDGTMQTSSRRRQASVDPSDWRPQPMHIEIMQKVSRLVQRWLPSASKWKFLQPWGFMVYKRSYESFSTPFLGDKTSRVSAPTVGYARDMRRGLKEMLIFLVSSKVKTSVWASFNFCLISGAVATFVEEFSLNAELNIQSNPTLTESIEYNKRSLWQLVGDFGFLPTFLLTFMVVEEASRWVRWFEWATLIQNRIHDVALILSGAHPNCSDELEGLRNRKVLYRYYRYLNCVHYLVYWKIVPHIGGSVEEVLSDLVIANLLTEDEANKLAHAAPKMRDTVLAWINILWHVEVQQGMVQPLDTPVFLERLNRLRAMCAAFLDEGDMQRPNSLLLMLSFSNYVLLALCLVAYPLNMHEKGQCLQPWTMASTFLKFFCHHGLLKVFDALALSPFDIEGDPVNVDFLLCGTDNTIFASMRAGFVMGEKEAQEDEGRKQTKPFFGSLHRTPHVEDHFNYNSLTQPSVGTPHFCGVCSGPHLRSRKSRQEDDDNSAVSLRSISDYDVDIVDVVDVRNRSKSSIRSKSTHGGSPKADESDCLLLAEVPLASVHGGKDLDTSSQVPSVHGGKELDIVLQAPSVHGGKDLDISSQIPSVHGSKDIDTLLNEGEMHFQI